MPKGDYVALLNPGRNSSRLTPVVVTRNRGTLGGELRGREGFLFRGGLSGSFYIAEQINRHKS